MTEIPGLQGYFATPEGKIYHKDKEVPTHHRNKLDKNLCIEIYRKKRCPKHIRVVQLIIKTFHLYHAREYEYYFKDGDPKNCRADNIDWRLKKPFEKLTMFDDILYDEELPMFFEAMKRIDSNEIIYENWKSEYWEHHLELTDRKKHFEFFKELFKNV
jgi:hypothetical protein